MKFFCPKCGDISAKEIKRKECECGETFKYQGTISTDDDFNAMRKMGKLESIKVLEI